jgi:hypothetical protein
MKESDGIEQAKQGQPDAIAALMNRQLKSKGIQVQARRRNDCLQMRFKSSKVPQKDQLTAWVHRGLERLHPVGIDRVQVEGWKHGASRPVWVETIALTPTAVPQSAVNQEIVDAPRIPAEMGEAGDSEAIARAMNNLLLPHLYEARVRMRDRVLILTVSGSPAPTPHHLKTLLQPYIESQSDWAFERIQVESKAKTEDFLVWSQDWQDILRSKPPRSNQMGLKLIFALIAGIIGFLVLGYFLFAILLSLMWGNS